MSPLFSYVLSFLVGLMVCVVVGLAVLAALYIGLAVRFVIRSMQGAGHPRLR